MLLSEKLSMTTTQYKCEIYICKVLIYTSNRALMLIELVRSDVCSLKGLLGMDLKTIPYMRAVEY
jgi:hypothetical protein